MAGSSRGLDANEGLLEGAPLQLHVSTYEQYIAFECVCTCNGDAMGGHHVYQLVFQSAYSTPLARMQVA